MYAIKSFVIINLCISPLFCNGYSFFGLSTISDIFDKIKNVVYLGYSKYNGIDIASDDTNLDIVQLATKYGYAIEEHTVVTEDDYILSLHRLSNGKDSTKNNEVIFLMHGILDSSDSWILQGPNNALAYILADEGYDVWLGNARGNKYSSSHVKLDNKKAEYWRFSWEEIGVYDLPSTIDYILNITGKEDLHYIGHSQGTTVFFAMLAVKPEYNAKIKMMFALSPIAWIDHAKSPFMKLFTSVYEILTYFTSNINTYSSSTEVFNGMPKLFCSVLPTGCENILEWVIGNEHKFINASLLPIIYGHIPSGSSTLQFIHYGQLFQSGRFCRFDYGPCDNYDKYGQVIAPDYDLNNVQVPVVLFYSNNDWLSDVTDVKKLINRLPNIYDSHNIEYFNHVDYMYADIAKDLIYLNISKIIETFESNKDAKTPETTVKNEY